MKIDELSQEITKNETRLLHMIKSDYVVKPTAAYQDENLQYIIMENIGKTLTKFKELINSDEHKKDT